MSSNQIGDHRFEGVPLDKKHSWMQGGNGPVELSRAQARLTRLGNALTEADDRLRRAAAKLGAEWDSEAGTLAGLMMFRAASWAGDSSTAAATAQGRMQAQADAVSTVTSAVPPKPPVTYTFGDALQDGFTSFIGLTNNMDREVEKQRAADNAANRALYAYKSSSESHLALVQPLPEAPKLTGAATPEPPPTPPADPPIVPPGGRRRDPAIRQRDPGQAGHQQQPGQPRPHDPQLPQQEPLPPEPRPNDQIDPSLFNPGQPPTSPGPIGGPNVPGGPGGLPGGPGGGFAGGVVGGFGPTGSGGGPGSSGSGTLGRGSGPTPGVGNQPGAARPTPTPGAAGRPGAAGHGFTQPAAPAAGRGEDDVERVNEFWVKDDDLFADERRAAPPVLGEGPG
ncbi:PPE domain-containing protein [Crossiella sp. CA198]|uniref:PPE domain-containing protein n=1 Tax=Crossiella sp. CA198 TaxID=3455607 RepID=UPI003F8D14D5